MIEMSHLKEESSPYSKNSDTKQLSKTTISTEHERKQSRINLNRMI